MWVGEALFVNYWVYLQFVLWRTASEGTGPGAADGKT